MDNKQTTSNGVEEEKKEEQLEDLDINQEDEELALCEKQKNEYLELSKRLKADFENLKRASQKDIAKTIQLANKDLVEEVLPVLDSLDLALKHIPEDLEGNNWVQGILGTKGQFESILKSFGVEEIKTVGEVFDPVFHEAVTQEESDEEEDIILEEVQKGYKLNGELVRASKVKVSK